MSYSEAIERIQGIVSETALVVCDIIREKSTELYSDDITTFIDNLKQEIKDNE